jgi:hypothetical protein
MQNGFSFESFAAVIGVGRRTLYEWVDAHEEFSHAKDAGQQKSLLWWERVNMAHALGKIKTGGANVIYTMKCRFGWNDQDLDTSDLDLTLKYNID